MPKVPRGLSQATVIRVFVNAGGVEVPGRGKGSHRSVIMPNGFAVVVPSGAVKTGLLANQIKGAELTVEEFIRFLRGRK
jgi:predicted RNA binding protein YcfA (HicA-like mRNA interferase family)